MGSNWSSLDRGSSPDLWWLHSQSQQRPENHVEGEEIAGEIVTESPRRGQIRQDELEAFKQELAEKRAQRHEALAALQAEMRELRRKAEEERSLRSKAEEERDKLRKIVQKTSGIEVKMINERKTTLELESGNCSETEEDKINLLVEIKNSMQEKTCVENLLTANLQTEMNPEFVRVSEETEQIKATLEEERKEKKRLLVEKEKLLLEVEEKVGLERQVQALKDVSEIGKEMLRIRELQVKELKKKLVEINMSVVMQPPEDLRNEYEKQIENIRKLRTLYEERAAATLIEHRRQLEREEARIVVLETKLGDLQKETDDVKEAKKELDEKIEKLESTIQHKENELETTKEDLFSCNVQNKNLNSQMMLINNLFSHMLISPQVDLDRLVRLLKENHGLITELTIKGDSNEVAALLVDLAGQVEKEMAEKKDNDSANCTTEVDANIESEIASNFTKVWRVMLELLSHHQNPTCPDTAGGAESCYKFIQTPSGPRSVISVSQTFLTLKDLILEKNRLVREVGRLKTLNNHLEDRLGNQEKRLSFVTTELRKTWGVVNKLKAQHKALHTHEKILRYELQQKRCMLSELKQELEHCRDKWGKAREKNSQTEEDWKKLRKEFADRKTRKESNSAESGYEEEDTAQSPPTEPTGHTDLSFTPKEQEEDIEHSDGNSFDTVIDLLDTAYLENHPENDSTVQLLVTEEPSGLVEISPSLLPLIGSEFTAGLDQIESEDLAAVLDVQYQNQLIGADYNLSLPSSSGSSPVPTENDDFVSSEIDISEESSSSNDNQQVDSSSSNLKNNGPEESFLFGSNSSRNISKFLDGLFVENSANDNKQTGSKLKLSVNDTFEIEDDLATPIVQQQEHNRFSINDKTPLINEEFEFPLTNKESFDQDTNKTKLLSTEPVHKQVTSGQTLYAEIYTDEREIQEARGIDEQTTEEKQSAMKSQEDMLKAREDRLKRLEQQCRALVSKVTSTKSRGEKISNKLDKLHLTFGSSEETSDIEDEIINMSTQDKTQEIPQKIANNPACTGAIPKTTKLKRKSHSKEDASSASVGSRDSFKINDPVLERTPEEILEARAARLKRLEDQCKSLFVKMSATSSRSDSISNKLDELHETHKGPNKKISNQTNTETVVKKSSSFEEPLDINLNPQSDKIKEHMSREDRRGSTISDLVGESKAVLNRCSLPGPSCENIPITVPNPKITRTSEEILEARAERFKRLEEQCKSLVSKMTVTSLRSEMISNKLDELHSCYGSSEDASESEDGMLSSKEDRRNFTPTASPRNTRKSAKLADIARSSNSNNMRSNENNKPEKELVAERVYLLEETNKISGKTNLEAEDRFERSPEELLNVRSQSLNQLEGCETLFSPTPAPSQRSDTISNRLEELHDHCRTAPSNEGIINVPSTLEESNSAFGTDRSLHQDGIDGHTSTSNKINIKLQEETSPSDLNDEG